MSMVAINLEGDFTKFHKILAEKLPWLRSSSILNLFEERKAISVPEANAEKSREIIMMVQSDILLIEIDPDSYRMKIKYYQ
jgi:hypothetical protein